MSQWKHYLISLSHILLNARAQKKRARNESFRNK